MGNDDKLSGNRKYSPLKREESPEKPPFRPDHVERGLEADDTQPLYTKDAIHDTRELNFRLDGPDDEPSGGYIPDANSPIDEADEIEARRLKAERAERDED